MGEEMGMNSGSRHGSLGRATVLSLLALALVCALALAVARPAWVSASPESQLTISPSQGAVGTAVTVTLIAQVDSVGQSYKLDATMADASTAAPCDPSTLQPIPGVAPFVIAAPSGGQPAGATVNFTWPTALDHGPYWLCAVPATSAGIGYTSTNQFTVLGAVPTAVPPPAASGAVNASLSGVQVGSTFTISISHWENLSSTPPQLVYITKAPPPLGGPPVMSNVTSMGVSAPVKQVTPGPGPGDYTLTVTVPKVGPTVYYVVVANQQHAIYAGLLSVQAPPAPPTQATPPPVSVSGSSDSPSLLVVGILLAIILVMLAAVLLRARERRQRAAQQVRERQAREQYVREQQYRQQQQYASQQPPRDQWGREQQQQQWGQPQPTREEWARTHRPPRDPRQ